MTKFRIVEKTNNRFEIHSCDYFLFIPVWGFLAVRYSLDGAKKYIDDCLKMIENNKTIKITNYP